MILTNLYLLWYNLYMELFRIVKDNATSLRSKSVDVDQKDIDEAINLVNKMHDYLVNSQDEEIAKKYNLREGVGLAAPQIGINKKIISVYFTYKDDNENEVIVDHRLINPRIISESVKLTYLQGGEGCLSVDNEHEGYVYRKYKVLIKAIDAKDKKEKVITARGYEAIVLQHEIDHLNGILFYDHIDKKDPFKIIDGSIRL